MIALPFLAIAWILADAQFDFSPLINVGAIGVVLAWMLWKAEPRMRAVEAAIDRQTQAILILLLEIDRTTPQAKEQAKVIQSQIEEAKKIRNGN